MRKLLLAALLALAGCAVGDKSIAPPAPESAPKVKSSPAPADVRGPSALALTKDGFPCGAFLSTFAGASAPLGTVYLFKTFGQNLACLQTFLADPRAVVINQTITNNPGLRNRRLESYEPLFGLTNQQFCAGLEQWNPAVIQRVQRAALAAAAELRPLVQPRHVVWVTPDLESSCSLKAQGEYIRAVRHMYDDFPGPVLFVSFGGLAPGADLYEPDHGPNPKCTGDPRCVKNNDGSTNVNFANFYGGAAAGKWGWKLGSNCNNGARSYQRPKLRRGCWSSSDAATIRPFLNRAPASPIPAPAPLPPGQCRNPADGYKVGWTSKASEAHGNALVVILPCEFAGAHSLSVTKNGQLVDVMPFADTFREDNVKCRPMFRSAKLASRFPDDVVVTTDTGACWNVHRISQRVD